MDLKELIKLAEGLDNKDKQELILFLQTRTKGTTAPIRVIDEIQEQKHKDGLVCPHCQNRAVVRFGKYVINTVRERLSASVTVAKHASKRSMTLRTPLYSGHGDLICGFDLSNS